MYITSTWPPESELWNSPTSALQMCTASLYRSTDCLPLISMTAVMLRGHADAYILSVCGRRSISVCAYVVSQAIVGLYVAA